MTLKLTIVICVHGYFPDQYYGTAVYVRWLAAALKRQGHRPVVLTVRFDARLKSAERTLPQHIDGIEVYRIVRPVVRSVRETYEDPNLVPILVETLRSIRADVVHLGHFLGVTTAVLEAAKHLGLPSFATLVDFHGLCHRGTLLDSQARRCSGPDRRATNCLSCGLQDRASERTNSFVFAYLSLPAVRPLAAAVTPRVLSYLPFALRRDAEDVIERTDRLKAGLSSLRAALAPTKYLQETYKRHGFSFPIEVSRFGVDADRSVRSTGSATRLRVGFIGQISWPKGCHVLVRAAGLLANERIDFAVWGDTERNPDYGKKLRRAAVGARIDFRGGLRLDELDEALRTIDVLVIPSLWPENSPLTLLHALACHTPAIVSDQPGMTEHIVHGVNGLVVQSNDHRGLALELKRLAANRARLDVLASQAHYCLTPDDMARDVLVLYQRHGVVI